MWPNSINNYGWFHMTFFGVLSHSQYGNTKLKPIFGITAHSELWKAIIVVSNFYQSIVFILRWNPQLIRLCSVGSPAHRLIGTLWLRTAATKVNIYKMWLAGTAMHPPTIEAIVSWRVFNFNWMKIKNCSGDNAAMHLLYDMNAVILVSGCVTGGKLNACGI